MTKRDRTAEEWEANANRSAKKTAELFKEGDQSFEIAAYLEKHGFKCLGDALAKSTHKGE